MLDPTKTRFWKAALQSELLDAAGLASCWEAIVPEKRADEDQIDRRLARQAVQLKLLTLWQAQQLLAGRSTGFKVDRYVLLDLIGQGGMGRVYLARDSRLGRQVALKILSPERINNPRAIARFQREARVGAQLQHENLVRLYDFGETQGRHFLVMEFIEGKTLGFHIATRGRIAPEDAARFCRQVALGLDHAHQKALIHRDVNPYNVIVTHEGVAKLTDMGLAMDLADEGKVTRDGATVGTFDYVAPEQARHSHSADIRSDVYSLGCTLYHALAGQVPFPQPGLAEKLFAHQSQEATRLETMAPEVPTGLADVVRKMMRKDPAERFATPGEAAAALLPFTGAGAADPAAASTIETIAGERGTGLGSGETVAATAAPAAGAKARPAAAFSFHVDLGPQPSLSDSVRNPRGRFLGSGSKPSTSSGSASASPSSESGAAGSGSWARAATRRHWPIAAAVLGIVAAGLLFAATRGKGGGSSPPATTKGNATGTGLPDNAAKPAPAIDWGDASVAIRARDGSTRPAADLATAMETALGGRGTVVVKGGATLVVPADAARSLSARGTIEIEGEPGGTASLRVELGDKPWMTTGSSANLVLRDLTIEVARAPKANGPPPPLCQTAGRTTFERCAFRTIPALGFPNSRAVTAGGGSVDVRGCWFEGFDAAVEIRAMSGVEHRIRGSMFVPGGTPMEAAKANLPIRRGWAVKAVFEGGGQRDGQRRLTIERCTITGEGLLRMEGFAEASPLLVAADSCAARVERLVDASPAPWKPKALSWEGSGNRFDVTGESWATAGSSETGAATASDWSRLYPEKALDETGVRFSMHGQTPDGRLLPSAYSLLGPDGETVGAIAAEVGPRP